MFCLDAVRCRQKRRLRQSSAETVARRTALKTVEEEGEDSLKHTSDQRRVLVAAESHASVCPAGVCAMFCVALVVGVPNYL